MTQLISYLNFLLRSTNAHGVHSPFVFNYLTQCLYTHPKFSKNKLENIILKSISYFNSKNIWLEDESLGNTLNLSSLPSLNTTAPQDLMVFKKLELQVVLEMISNKKVHNDTLFIVQSLKKNRVEWEKIRVHPKITVSIDSFSLGIFFIRKEQVKEHFTIRL